MVEKTLHIKDLETTEHAVAMLRKYYSTGEGNKLKITIEPDLRPQASLVSHIIQFYHSHRTSVGFIYHYALLVSVTLKIIPSCNFISPSFLSKEPSILSLCPLR